MKHMVKQKRNLLVGLFLLSVGVLTSGTTVAYGANIPAVFNLSVHKPGSALSQVQQKTITGKVTDATTRQVLPGVNVYVKGTTIGAATDANGKYSLSVPESADTLVYSYIGYSTRYVAINNRSVINVRLTQKAINGKQLVVVGYGSQQKEAVTGSVVSISAAKMNEVPSSNITGALQGRLPGVQIQQTSSQPGAAMQIRIRGTRSLTASNNPLIVLNGVPFGGSLSDIDPNQIKNISILKDASATAIYGSRGANGVILIQTLKGQKGQKPQISYNSYMGVKKIFSYYPMMNGPQFVALNKAAGEQYPNGADENNNVNTNWQKLFFRPSAALDNQNLNISGGTANGSYNFGLGYYNDQSLVPTQNFKRYTLNGSISQQIGKYVSVNLTTNTDYNTSNGSQIDIYNVLSMSPLASPYNSNGTLRRTIHMNVDNNWTETRSIIDSLKNQWTNPHKTLGTYNNLSGIVSIPRVKGLKYHVNLGLNYTSANNDAFTGEGIDNSTATTPSVASITHAVTLDWNIQNLLTYDRTFLGKHHVDITALYSATKDSYNSSDVSAQGIPNPNFQFYQLGQNNGTINIDPANQKYQVSGLESWMGRVMYTYSDLYMLTATIRSDGSSRLATGHQWHTYPALSVGWNIANEPFMKSIHWLNQLKLRVGYGETSNQAIAPYSTLGLLNTSPYNYGSTDAVGYYVSQLPNPDLGWEYSKTTNYGLDFSLFNNRLSGTLEYYVTKTHALLENVSLPSTSGVSGYTANIGKTQNKGLELSLSGVILRNVNGWTWQAGINVYGNRNKLVQLANGQTENEANWWFVGHPINVIYDYQKIGIWQKGDKYLSTLEPGGNVGMIKVKYTGGYNADGTPKRAIGPDDRQIMSVEPSWQGGFNTMVTYKGFDFTAVGVFQHGGLLDATLYGSNGYLDMLSGRRNNVNVNYWTPTNTSGTYPLPGGVGGDNPKYGSTLGYFNASYLKIQTLTLGYNFAHMNWLRNSGISKLRIYLQVQNPFVLFSPFYKQTGLDPQSNSYGNQNSAVNLSDNLKRILTVAVNTPATRNYLLGINLTF